MGTILIVSKSRYSEIYNKPKQTSGMYFDLFSNIFVHFNIM